MGGQSQSRKSRGREKGRLEKAQTVFPVQIKEGGGEEEEEEEEEKKGEKKGRSGDESSSRRGYNSVCGQSTFMSPD